MITLLLSITTYIQAHSTLLLKQSLISAPNLPHTLILMEDHHSPSSSPRSHTMATTCKTVQDQMTGFNWKMVMASINNHPTSIFDPSTSRYMVLYDGLTIETIITNKGSIVDEWIELVSSTCVGNQRIAGLDTEWMHAQKPKMKVAILQLCIENKCLIIQLFRMNNIPQSLKSFLMDSDFKFVGVGVMNDLKMLKNDYGLECNNGIDVSLLAKEKWPDRISSRTLKYLAKELVGLHMEKSKDVCTSEWKSKDLSQAQVEYACIDAYASFKIGKMILDEDK